MSTINRIKPPAPSRNSSLKSACKTFPFFSEKGRKRGLSGNKLNGKRYHGDGDCSPWGRHISYPSNGGWWRRRAASTGAASTWRRPTRRRSRISGRHPEQQPETAASAQPSTASRPSRSGRGRRACRTCGASSGPLAPRRCADQPPTRRHPGHRFGALRNRTRSADISLCVTPEYIGYHQAQTAS